MAVAIRMKMFGRRHRPFFRICAIDRRRARNGRVIEELGTYDPMIPEVDARTVLNNERIQYWLSVGAKTSDKVGVLLKKYGEGGTHVEQQKSALARLAEARRRPEPVQVQAVMPVPRPKKAKVEEPAAEPTEAPAEAVADEPAAE